MIYAIERGNLDVVRTLVAGGADVNVPDKDDSPPLAHLGSPLSETGRQIEALLMQAGADADYNRRRGIWTCGVGGRPKTELFPCPTNSINHYTLLEFLAALYRANPGPGVGNVGRRFGSFDFHYSHPDDVVPFPDFARVSIHRLKGNRAETLRVNVNDILLSGDGSKDVALQAGDMIEIAELEHKVADKWGALSAADVTALNKHLLRTVRRVAQSKTIDIALWPSAGVANDSSFPTFRGSLKLNGETTWLTEALQGRKADTFVRSFYLNDVVRDANVLLNTWDLSRVRLTRGGVKMTFDLTSNAPPEVWLEEGDVIEIPELGEAAPATEAK